MGGLFIIFNKRIIEILVIINILLFSLITVKAESLKELNSNNVAYGYINDDTTYTYYPHDEVLNLISETIYTGEKVKVVNHKTVNGYKKIIHDEYYLDGYGDGIHSKEELKNEYKKVEDNYNDFEDFLEQNSYVKYSNWPCNDLEVEVTKKEINGQNVYAICAFGYDG